MVARVHEVLITSELFIPEPAATTSRVHNTFGLGAREINCPPVTDSEHPYCLCHTGTLMPAGPQWHYHHTDVAPRTKAPVISRPSFRPLASRDMFLGLWEILRSVIPDICHPITTRTAFYPTYPLGIFGSGDAQPGHMVADCQVFL
jgi:hypothetical protein